MNGFERRAKVKKQTIIDTAETLFLNKGMRQATIELIAKQANVSQVTIYNYFGSKEGLFYETLKRILESFTKEFEDLVYDASFSVDEKLLKLIEYASDMIDAIPSDVMMGLYYPKDARIKTMASWYHDNRIMMGMQHLIREGKKEGVINRLLSDEAILIYFGLFKQTANLEMIDNKAALKDLVHMFFYGIGGQS